MDAGLVERLERNLELEKRSKEAEEKLRLSIGGEHAGDEASVLSREKENDMVMMKKDDNDDDNELFKRLASSVLAANGEDTHGYTDDTPNDGANGNRNRILGDGGHAYGDYATATTAMGDGDEEEGITVATRRLSSREQLRHQRRQQRQVFPRAAAASATAAQTAGTHASATADAAHTGDEDASLDAGLGPAAAARLHKARATSLARDLASVTARYSESASEVTSLRSELKEAVAERDRLQRMLRQAESGRDKHKRAEEELSQRCEDLLRERAKERGGAAAELKSLKQLEAEHKSLQVRFTRATDELASMRLQLKSTTSTLRDEKDASGVATSKLAGDVRRLEREKAELVKAFKQQMKLVDVLKKQRVHVEAAQMLNFTEAEFRKALEKV